MIESSATGGGPSAGSILRAARERQGLHIAALAAAIKVAPRKLDALENDRWDELPDATFTRALAQTVCRSLKIDPAPVLALLPTTDPGLLDTVSGHLNAPFADHSGRQAVSNAAVRPMLAGGVVLLVAAVGLSFVPSGFWPGGEGRAPGAAGVSAPVAAVASAAVDAASQALQAAAAASEPPANAALASAAPAPSALPAAGAAPETMAPAGVASLAGAAANPGGDAGVVQPAARAQPAPGQGDGPVRLRAVQATWVSARDASGSVLLSRLLEAGEVVAVGGATPLRLVIGNAAGTELDYRGQKVDLASRTKDNVARVELQ